MGDCDVSEDAKEFSHVIRETVAEQHKNIGMKTTDYNSSQEEGELSPKNELLNNGHDAEGKTVNRHSYSNDSNNSRFLLLGYSTIISFLFIRYLILLEWHILTGYSPVIALMKLLCIFNPQKPYSQKVKKQP